MPLDPAAADAAADDEQCARCKHYPAYHDCSTGRPCRAWDPDQKDHLCGCSGWKKKAAPPAAADPGRAA